jgi:hypothetical protein
LPDQPNRSFSRAARKPSRYEFLLQHGRFDAPMPWASAGRPRTLSVRRQKSLSAPLAVQPRTRLDRSKSPMNFTRPPKVRSYCNYGALKVPPQM